MFKIIFQKNLLFLQRTKLAWPNYFEHQASMEGCQVDTPNQFKRRKSV